ncbi:hypothetical protein A2630_00005 [Candidatus Woesebacteria bacterium RIFCSPHIGHO2_01_FULL_44_10]|uniref:Uncharacterized protein n=1 Tax=Candidatus Woesebacteria bacterium RIFCSPLOWO2_01_FULL_44_14 TaxID=1802525 RepID=A0A1F8BX68_9BACT|nr:MAG: hypothetical protein A2630_00005 [Candidatus Woesebacteria bacterium RIFCSPHIGHO2_01_FULL_44_10]OGM56257.1 MAG: hypothetical protein A3F62_03325 [Candidatus Woesebacteria bacterium RIFCSPHIGHO2_12_FULL_44_11]OGM68693.1 MAG: hypothetical protein A2975_05305 [Candidatus Woesebacteria bacterium RIFCSPLOWO2_01_FULL_44_14]
MTAEIKHREIESVEPGSLASENDDFIIHYQDGTQAELFNHLVAAVLQFESNNLSQKDQVLDRLGEAIAQIKMENLGYLEECIQVWQAGKTADIVGVIKRARDSYTPGV